MTSRVSTTIANPVRTVGQGGAGWLIAETVEAFGLYDFTERQWPLAIVILGGVVSAAQNYAENKGWIRAFLRTVPPVKVAVSDHVDETN